MGGRTGSKDCWVTYVVCTRGAATECRPYSRSKVTMSYRNLIVDDEEHIRRMMRLTLEAAGYEVAEAKEGAEGLNLYGDGNDCDAIVLDQRMPGMDGLETLRHLKQRNPTAA
jgi:CheY-like chemotaxis protein